MIPMRKLRTAIIGCGTIFPMHAQSIKNIKGVELVAVCDIKAGKARSKARIYGCKAHTDYKKMLKHEALDAVHVCTPHYLHMPMIVKAAESGINVITEKPMALDPAQARKEIAVARRNKVVLSVIFQNRFNPGSQLVKKRIRDGSLGRLKAAKLVLTYHKPDSYYKKSDWKGRLAKEGGGVVIDQAIHYLDIVRWLIPSPIKYVEANVSNRTHSFIDVEDSAEGVVMFKNGFYLCFYLINSYSFDDDPFIDIDCGKARVRIVKDTAQIKYFKGGSEKAAPRPNELIDYGAESRDYWGSCHYSQIKDFYACLRKGKPPAVIGEDALKTQELIWAIYESSRRTRRINL